MTTNTLQRFDKDGIELVIDISTGESFATKRGYARMSNKDESTIRKRIQGAESKSLKTAKIPTPGGLQGADLITEDLIAKWLPKDNPAMATQLMKLGTRAFMHKLAGYEINSTAMLTEKFNLPKTYLEALKALVVAEEDKLTLQAKLDAQEPLVKLSETLTTKAVDTVSVGELAKAYSMGRTTFFNVLREIGFIMQAPSRLPYQIHIDNERAEVVRKERVSQPGHFDAVTVVTAKGQEYIAKKLAEKDKASQVEVLLEATVELAEV